MVSLHSTTSEYEEETRKIDEEGEGDRGRENNTELVEDLITDILLELPVKSLMRFKCVCQLWYNLIISPYFVARQHKNSLKKEEVFMYIYSFKNNNTSTDISFRFHPATLDLTLPYSIDFLETVGCFNGLVCLSISQNYDQFVLWNPATRQITGIIKSSQAMELSYAGFCFDPIANTFKVARIAFIDESTSVNVNIFTLSSNSWTEKTIEVPFQMCGSLGSDMGDVTCVRRCMYWERSHIDQDWEVEDTYILGFDMLNYSFKRIEMPRFNQCVLKNSGICAYKESLAVFVCTSDYHEFDVLVLNDCGDNQSWHKHMTCKTSFIVDWGLGFSCSRDGTDLIILESDSSLKLYDPKTGETKELPDEEDVNKFYSYSESLVSVLS